MSASSWIRTAPDRRPPERCVGYGIPYTDGTLVVTCGTCKAPIGTPCDKKRGSGAHATRVDKARNHFQGRALRLSLQLERAALRRDPTGPLWTFQSLPHTCGVHGPHILTECRPESRGGAG